MAQARASRMRRRLFQIFRAPVAITAACSYRPGAKIGIEGSIVMVALRLRPSFFPVSFARR